MQEQGETSVRFVIGETGDVTECIIETSSGYPRLDVAACAMIGGRWKYKPATLGGRAVSQNAKANVVFQLRDHTFTGVTNVPEPDPSASDPGLDIPNSYVPPSGTAP
jgi:TonB family protein